MQSFYGSIRSVRRHSLKIVEYKTTKSRSLSSGLIIPKCSTPSDVKFIDSSIDSSKGLLYQTLIKFTSHSPLVMAKPSIKTDLFMPFNNGGIHAVAMSCRGPKPGLFHQSMVVQTLSSRSISTMNNSGNSVAQDPSDSVSGVAPRIKFKRLDKTAHHIMQILDKEAVEEVKNQREIPDIKPGYIIQLKVEVPDNKRRVSILKGIVIARRNAGLNTTFRLRRLVAGVGVESLFPLYSPNIKEIKVLDKKKVRRAKLYYLRDRMNPLKK
ncbi:50S ribosomal protein L19, chloroplastic-like isoform X1 [Actinidia eriantha]|uniref:50S ribosomal protein L19, chloroplastic-like isoform X1 n=1 Tax=Actinidia eriantha TaxID=165200 RepID=UPI0025851500|nr:50S ribosomal protein L19, chloroplastic-like isoform X1 [Actinidia eriantha]XP_057459339.1 50S ribosomal protein L19, chloroplastic-like isoform X1 [Actinidia eriantha]